MINQLSLKIHLFPNNITRSNSKYIIISDSDFTTMNPDDILMIIYYFQSQKTSRLETSSFETTNNFFKDYAMELAKTYIELHHLFKTGWTPQLRNISLEGIDCWFGAQIFLSIERLDQKDVLQDMEKHLIQTKVL